MSAPKPTERERMTLMMELAEACDELEFAEPGTAEFDDAEGRYRKAESDLKHHGEKS